MSGNSASCIASRIGISRRVFLEALSLVSLDGADDVLLSPDGMGLMF
jgi:GTP-sensing pleiotropic transcriptional regulator CodY